MLECEDLPAAQEAWQHSLQRAQDEQQQEAVAQAQAKKLIVQRFLLQPVPNGSNGDGKGRPPPLKAWGAGSSGESKCKARYREGAVVTSRGEKYIIEKQVCGVSCPGSEARVATSARTSSRPQPSTY